MKNERFLFWHHHLIFVSQVTLLFWRGWAMEPPCRDLLQPWELAEECHNSSYVLATMGLTKTCSRLSVLLPATPRSQRPPRHSRAPSATSQAWRSTTWKTPTKFWRCSRSWSTRRRSSILGEGCHLRSSSRTPWIETIVVRLRAEQFILLRIFLVCVTRAGELVTSWWLA